MINEPIVSPSHRVALPEDGHALRVLIVRIGAMGDVLHAMPAVAALRETHPDWFIGWAIEPRWSALLQTSSGAARVAGGVGRSEKMPLVDRCHKVATKDWKNQPFAVSTVWEMNALLRELRMAKYDVCVDMQGSLKSAFVGRVAGARLFAGPEKPREAPARWLYGQRVATSAVHVVEQGCELLGAALEETLRPGKVTLPIDTRTEAWCDRILGQTSADQGQFVFLAPSAGWGAKQWPAERYGAVAAALGRAGYRTLVNEASPGDRFAEAIYAVSEGFAEPVPCSVGQMIALVRRAGLVIAGDTGPLHLAAVLERPVVGLFGPTDPARTGPYVADRSKARVLRHGSSVSDHARRVETEAGLMQISVEEVVEAGLELLQTEQDKVKV